MITSYNDMPVGVYEKIAAVLAQDLPDDDQRLALLAALTGKTEDALLDEPLPAFREQMEAAGFLLTYPKPAKLRQRYTLRGCSYLPTTREDKMSAGQYIDFQTYAAQKGDNWAGVLSCILVPEGHAYNDGYDLGGVQDAIRAELCILDAIALRAFFLSSSALSTAATARSSALRHAKAAGMPVNLRLKMKAAMLKVEARSRNAGGGFRALTAWLRLPEALGTR